MALYMGHMSKSKVINLRLRLVGRRKLNRCEREETTRIYYIYMKLSQNNNKKNYWNKRKILPKSFVVLTHGVVADF